MISGLMAQRVPFLVLPIIREVQKTGARTR
jgi:hypothetical protein